MMDDNFDAKALALKPEHLKNLRSAETTAAKVERRKRYFAQITSDQIDRLTKTTNVAAWKIFLHLLLLNRYSPGKTIRLANVALGQIGVSRYAKYRALPELKKLGLIKMRKRPNKSPEIIVR
jgi:hypothetical protein